MTYNVYHTYVKYFDWNESKNEWLIANRGISFEMCLSAIERGDLLSNEPNKSPFEHQKRFVVRIGAYVYVILYVEDDEKIFLKTMYPSRLETKKYLPKKSTSSTKNYGTRTNF